MVFACIIAPAFISREYVAALALCLLLVLSSGPTLEELLTSLLDNAPDQVVGCIIQKGLCFFLRFQSNLLCSHLAATQFFSNFCCYHTIQCCTYTMQFPTSTERAIFPTGVQWFPSPTDVFPLVSRTSSIELTARIRPLINTRGY